MKCKRCNGEGEFYCPKCSGNGYVMKKTGILEMPESMDCPLCGGTVKKQCPRCQGSAQEP